MSAAPLRILAGSENKALEPILADFTRQSGIPVEMVYRGSVDIMLELQQGAVGFQAVWPANSLWIDLSGNKMIRGSASITRSPVVFGIKRSRAAQLGLTLGQPLPMRRVLEFTRAGKLNFLMTNPTQSNSGAMGYLGFLHVLSGREDAFTAADLARPDLAADIQNILSAVDRNSGSSGWLKDLYLANPELYDSMVNYESTLIEINEELARRKQEPLLVFYPADGQAIADSPLAYVVHSEEDRETDFVKLRDYLLSPEIQSRLGMLGRRTGLVGTETNSPSFRSEWGLDAPRILQPFPLPSAEVIRSALGLYQTNFKKPSLTVFVLDLSGSMQGVGERQLKAAMNLLLVESEADRYLLRTGVHDETVIVPFDSVPREILRTSGNNADSLEKLRGSILRSQAGGGTDIYAAAIAALREISLTKAREDYAVSIILMTDGKSEGRYEDLMSAWKQTPVPIFTIMFGDADPAQLERISKATRARSFDGRKNLISAFREAKAYN